MAKTLRSSIDDITKKYLAEYGIKGEVKGVEELPQFIKDFGDSEMFVEVLNNAFKTGNFSDFYRGIAGVESQTAIRNGENPLIYDLKDVEDFVNITKESPLKTLIPPIFTQRQSYDEMRTYLSGGKVPASLMDATPEQLMKLLSAADYTDRQWQKSETSRDYLLKLKKVLGPVKEKEETSFDKKNAYIKALEKVDNGFSPKSLADAVQGKNAVISYKNKNEFDYKTEHIDLTSAGMMIADQAARQAYSIIVRPVIENGLDSAKVSLTDQFRLSNLYSFDEKKSYTAAVGHLLDQKEKFETMVEMAKPLLREGVKEEEFRNDFLDKCCAHGVFSAKDDEEFYRLALGAVASCSASIQGNDLSVITFKTPDGSEQQVLYARNTIEQDGEKLISYARVQGNIGLDKLEENNGQGLIIHDGTVIANKNGSNNNPIDYLRKYNTKEVSDAEFANMEYSFDNIPEGWVAVKEKRYQRINTYGCKNIDDFQYDRLNEELADYCLPFDMKPDDDTIVMQMNPFVEYVLGMQQQAEKEKCLSINAKSKIKAGSMDATSLSSGDSSFGIVTRPVLKAKDKKKGFNYGLFKSTKWYQAQKAEMRSNIARYAPIGPLEKIKGTAKPRSMVAAAQGPVGPASNPVPPPAPIVAPPPVVPEPKNELTSGKDPVSVEESKNAKTSIFETVDKYSVSDVEAQTKAAEDARVEELIQKMKEGAATKGEEYELNWRVKHRDNEDQKVLDEDKQEINDDKQDVEEGNTEDLGKIASRMKDTQSEEEEPSVEDKGFEEEDHSIGEEGETQDIETNCGSKVIGAVKGAFNKIFGKKGQIESPEETQIDDGPELGQ